jgi:hypothetical protein
VRDAEEVTAVGKLRIGAQRRAVLDGANRDAVGLEQRLDRRRIARACPGGHLLVECVLVRAPRGRAQEARVAHELGASHGRAQRQERPVTVDGDRHPAVVTCRWVDAVGDEVRVPVADPVREPAVRGVIEQCAGEEVQRRLRLGEVDELSGSGPAAVLERRQDRRRDEARRHVVGVGAERPRRRAIGPAAEVGEPRDGGGEVAVAGERRPRPDT